MDRRHFLWATSAAALGIATKTAGGPTATFQEFAPGVQLYSVHDLARSDLNSALESVRQIGFRSVEFETTCIECDTATANALRAHMDRLGLHCPSTLCGANQFAGDALERSLDVAAILGCRYMVLPHPDRLASEWRNVSGWRNVARVLNEAVAPAKARGIRIGYHNHQPEFLPLAERRTPIEIVVSETDPAIGFELDVANCLASYGDPVEFLERYGSRTIALHFKDWSSDAGVGYSVGLGKGSVDWTKLLRTAAPYVPKDCYFIEMEPQREPALTRLEVDYHAAHELMALAAR